MSTIQFSLNRAIVSYLMLNKARFMLGEMFLEISLKTPTIGDERKAKVLANSGKLATKENHAESLSNLADNAMLAFSVKLVTTNHKTDFSHDLLSVHNETEFTQESRFTVWANNGAIEIEQGYETHMEQEIDLTILHSLVRLMVKQGKGQKSAQKWKTVKGIYTPIISE